MPGNEDHLELKLKKRVKKAGASGRLDLASTPNCRFRFKKVPSAVYAAFGLKDEDNKHKSGTLKGASASTDGSSSSPSTASQAAVPLRELWLSNNSVSILTREIYSLKRLETLCLSSNNLSVMPSTIGDLPELRRLLLSGNKITSVPSDIARLKHIEEIRLDANRLSEFPLVLTELTTLRRLGLSQNRIGPSIPSQVRKLGNLVEMDLDHNSIENLPRGIVFLRRTLQQLGLAFNRFASVPQVVSELTALDVLRLEGNRSYVQKDPETGEEQRVFEVPMRHDGFCELRTGEHILKDDGTEEHIVHKLPGYLEESIVYNRMNAEWIREKEAVYEVGLLKARARRRAADGAASVDDKK